MDTPHPTLGLRHIALFVHQLDDCVSFYTELLGMKIDWKPDQDNVYLTSGHDNFALHRAPEHFQATGHQRLDHIGFMLESMEQVDIWHEFLKKHHVVIKTPPRTHRDGARSFYCFDPEGTTIQMIYHSGVK